MTRFVGFACLLALTACGAASGPSPTASIPTPDGPAGTLTGPIDLVSVTTQQGSLPPPEGQATVHAFTSPAQIEWFHNSVVRNNITQLAAPTTSNGCVGGTTIKIQILYPIAESSPGVATSNVIPSATLNAYQCGGTITGNIGGNVSQFLADLNAGPAG